MVAAMGLLLLVQQKPGGGHGHREQEGCGGGDQGGEATHTIPGPPVCIGLSWWPCCCLGVWIGGPAPCMRVCGMASRGTRLERGRDRGELSQALEPRSLLTPPEGPTGKGMEGSWLQKCFIDQPTFLSGLAHLWAQGVWERPRWKVGRDGGGAHAKGSS